MENKIRDTGDVREGFIGVTGGKVWYRIVGVHKKGIPLLMLHGGPGAPHDYLEPIEPLSDERPVVFYDQLGCGNSDRPKNTSLWTVERFVGEVAQVRQALKLDRVHILGQSWGALLAIDYLITKKPDGVASLILSGPLVSSSRFAADAKAYVKDLSADMQKAIHDSEVSGNFSTPEYEAAMMAYYKKHVCRLDPWPDCVNSTFEKLGQEVYNHMWGPSEFTVTGTLINYDLTGRLGEVNIPTLFTSGQYDEVPPETTKYYQSMLPGSEMVVFEGASHMHHIERQEQYLEVVRDFLKRAEAR